MIEGLQYSRLHIPSAVCTIPEYDHGTHQQKGQKTIMFPRVLKPGTQFGYAVRK